MRALLGFILICFGINAFAGQGGYGTGPLQVNEPVYTREGYNGTIVRLAQAGTALKPTKWIMRQAWGGPEMEVAEKDIARVGSTKDGKFKTNQAVKVKSKYSSGSYDGVVAGIFSEREISVLVTGKFFTVNVSDLNK